MSIHLSTYLLVQLARLAISISLFLSIQSSFSLIVLLLQPTLLMAQLTIKRTRTKRLYGGERFVLPYKRLSKLSRCDNNNNKCISDESQVTDLSGHYSHRDDCCCCGHYFCFSCCCCCNTESCCRISGNNKLYTTKDFQPTNLIEWSFGIGICSGEKKKLLR